MQYFYLHGFLSGPQSNKGKFLNLKFNQSGNNLISPDLNDGDFSRMTISSQQLFSSVPVWEDIWQYCWQSNFPKLKNWY
jgi:hypothetical protein